MRRTLPRTSLVCLALAMVAVFAAAEPVTERVTLFNGDTLDNVTGVTFDGERFQAPGREPVPRNDVQSVEFRPAEAGPAAARAAAPAAAALTPLAQSLLPKGAEMARAYPGVPGVILVDDGVFTYRSDGTNMYRYHFAGVVLKEEMQSWAQVGAGFTEGRSRVRVLFARSVAPDGTVAELDPETLKVTSPSEEMAFFNPDRKVLSGVIPGVEVGSVVEYAYEYDYYNPEDPRLFSPGFFFQGTEPMVLSRLTVEMPRDVTLNYATRNFADAAAARPKETEHDGVRTYVWQQENMPPIAPEPLMPPQEDIVPMVEASIFKSFDDIYDLLRKLQQPRIQPTPAIQAAVAQVTEGAATLEDKIARIYYWVQENTRYISIKGSLGAGFSGHTAQETFENRYGDCTDKAILFSTMLGCIGVESYPIIVNTNDAGVAVTEIPVLSGNHCITEVCLDSRRFYLDSTAQDYRYPYFRADDHGVYALNAIRGDIHSIPVPDPADNRRFSRLDVTLDARGDAVVKTRNEYTGNIEAGIRGFWKQVREDNRKPMMSEYVNSISPGAVLEDFSLSRLEDLAQPVTMTLDYRLPGHAIRARGLMYLRVPTLEREFPEAGLETRRYPLQYMTTEERVLEVELQLPEGFRVKWAPPPLDIDTPYVTYHARYEDRGATVAFHEEFRRLQRIVPVADYPAYRDALRAIAAFTQKEIFLSRKG